MEINLEFGGMVAICSSVFVNLRLYYLKCSNVVYNITFFFNFVG